MPTLSIPRRPLALALLLASASLPAQQWIQHTLPPVPNATSVALRDVDGTAPNDVWLVGSYTQSFPGYSTQNTLAMHYDGAAWSVVAAPNPIGPGGPHNGFQAVKAFAPDDVWVAGSWYTTGAGGFPTSDLYIAHWDGSSWTPMVTTAASPNGNGHQILDIVASGPDDIWFLGQVMMGISRALALHWDGSSFQFHYGPPPATAIGANLKFQAGAVLSSSDIWLVGGGINFLMTSPYIVHHDGSSMSIVPGATSGNTYSITSVAALATNDVWVHGEEQSGSSLTALLWRWNGTSWTQAPAWSPGFHAHCLHTTGTELLAGGIGGVQRWNGTAWLSETTLPAFATPVVQQMGNAGSSVFAIGNAGGVPGTAFLIERQAGVVVAPTATVRMPCTGVAPQGSMQPIALARIGHPWSVAIGDPTNAAQLLPGQTLSVWLASWLPAPGHPCGVQVPWGGYGGQPGELLVDPSPPIATFLDSPQLWNGPTTPAVHTVQMPVLPSSIGLSVYCQGALFEFGPTTSRLVLTAGVDFTIGS